MRTFLVLFVFLAGIPTISFADPFIVTPVLKKQVFEGNAVLGISPNIFAGAISSFRFRDVEYVDNYDHGRQMQSAMTFNYYGECFNPTESGGMYDLGPHHPSSSVLQKYDTTGDTFLARTRM